MTKHVLIAIALCACSSDSAPVDLDDHAPGRVMLEGTELTDFFGPDHTSDPIALGAFRRVGFLWDAMIEDAFEVRTSRDGATWTEWSAPTTTSAELPAHTGHVDTTDVDPSGWVQLRVRDDLAVTFLIVEPLLDIPAESEDAGMDTQPDPDDVAKPTGIGNLTVHSRSEWGARAPRCSMDSQKPVTVTIHHTDTPTNDSMTPQARLRQIQAFHMFNRGWCDIGYNYLVSRDGRVWRGRGAGKVGAHTQGANTGNVGISFIGTYTSTAPTATQMCESAKLIRRLHLDNPAIKLERADVKGHRQYNSTSCPGNALYDRIATILRKARGGCETP